MDPKGVLRESRDSAEHPESTAIAVLLDVTGSMRNSPRVMQKKLCELMALLLRKGYVTDPQILVGAIGDATCDRAPFQVGQFESGVEMDEDLGRIYLEGNGGGNSYESYELAMWFMANQTSTDCFEKRGKKGYLFIIGDEKPGKNLMKEQVERVLGQTIENDIPLEDVFKQVQEKWEVFHIRPAGTGHYNDPRYSEPWTDAIGQNVLYVDDPNLTCEMIASAIALCEGIDLDDAMTDLGDVDLGDSVEVVTRALTPLSQSLSVTATTENSSNDAVKRI